MLRLALLLGGLLVLPTRMPAQTATAVIPTWSQVEAGLFVGGFRELVTERGVHGPARGVGAGSQEGEADAGGAQVMA